MTYLVISAIGVVLLGIVMTAAIMYVDMDEATAAGMGPAAASSLMNVVEASEAFKAARGHYPLSLADLETEFSVSTRGLKDADYIISDGIACLSMPYEIEVNRMLEAAADRIAGAVVTDNCGSSDISGRRFLAFSMDGVSVPLATAFSQSGTAPPSDPFAAATTCTSLNFMPLGTDAEKAAYIMKAGECVEERSQLTNQRLVTLDDIGSPSFDYTGTGGGNVIFDEQVNGNIWFRYDVDNQPKCDIMGYRANGNFSLTLEDQCYWGYAQPRRYYKRLTDTYRPAQAAFLESEANKILNSWNSSSYGGTDMAEFIANHGGYNPNMKGHAVGDWFINSRGTGDVQFTVVIPHEGFCTWLRQQKGYSSNRFDYAYRTPDYCWYHNSSSTNRYQLNVSVPFRAKQKQILERERQLLRADYVAKGGNTAAMTYVPKFDGVTVPNDPTVGNYVSTSGKMFYRARIDQGLCHYLFDERAATQNVSWNELNYYYRPVMCREVYTKGFYAMLDLTVD